MCDQYESTVLVVGEARKGFAKSISENSTDACGVAVMSSSAEGMQL